ncbi:hypothetical protein VTK26DRAFT_5013 [Humicola hyalothermophila]
MLRRSSLVVGRTVAGAVGPYVPRAVTEMLEPQRDFAKIKIPRPNQHGGGGGASQPGGGGGTLMGGGGSAPLKSVVAMSSSSPQVMVVTSDGNFYVFNIDMQNGGDGYLVKQYSVLDDKLDASEYGS